MKNRKRPVQRLHAVCVVELPAARIASKRRMKSDNERHTECRRFEASCTYLLTLPTYLYRNTFLSSCSMKSSILLDQSFGNHGKDKRTVFSIWYLYELEARSSTLCRSAAFKLCWPSTGCCFRDFTMNGDDRLAMSKMASYLYRSGNLYAA